MGEEGLWLPYPVEYKRGSPKAGEEDKLQLCAQAMCLEEMLCCSVPEGSLFYGETRRRLPVIFTLELRQTVEKLAEEMHGHFQRGYTPKGKPGKSCSACSLKELCLPKLMKQKSVNVYLQEAVKDSL